MISSVNSSSCNSSYRQNYKSFALFCKFLSSRLVQVLVQARSGEDVSQRCSVGCDQADWFNLRIDELGEVSALLRQTIPSYPPSVNDLCIDFLLYTADGEFLPLESWHLSVHEIGDEEEKWSSVRTQLYVQMGVLLKSAMASARVTPMYRYYVRHQSADTFVIFYRVYTGEPELDLGEGQKSYCIGSLKSPYGTISLNLMYRTKMEIERSLKRPEKKEEVTEKLLDSGDKEEQLEESTSCKRLSIPFANIKQEASNVDPDDLSSQCDALSTFSVSPASQRTFSRTGSVSSRLSFRCDRSVSSSDESNFFGTSSSPRFSEPFLKGFPAVGRENQPPRASSLPFFALLTASTSSVVFRSQLKILNKVPENESISSASSANTVSGDNDNDNDSPHSDAPSDRTLTDENRVETPAGCESQEIGDVDTIQGSTVSTVVDSAIGRSSCYQKNVSESTVNKTDFNSDSDDDLDIQLPLPVDISSDDSFVKVPFGSWHGGDGSDLGDFVHLFRMATQTNIAFTPDQPYLITEQLTRFESQQGVFDRFLASLVDPEGECHFALRRACKPVFY